MLQYDYHTASKAPRKSSIASTRSQDDREDSRTAGRWTREEHLKFVEGLKKFGKNWKAVEDYVGTRTGAQVRSHAQKFFNKLEKEFGIKFENLNLEEQKAKFEETLRKMSDHAYSGASSTVKDEIIPELQMSKKIEKTLSPVPEFSVNTDTLTQNSVSVQSMALSQSNSPKLNHFETSASIRRAPRKMSEDILSERNYSLFDIIMSKIRSANNRIITPTLSDLVDLTSSTRSSFDESHLHYEPAKKVKEIQGFVNTSFRMNPRKMSEDNILMKLTQLRRPDETVFDDCEPLVKKLHANYH